MDSSTGGFLQPSDASPPLADAGLEDVLQAMIAALTGLPGYMVRPRWQAVTPQQPEATEDWCALGIERIEADGGPAIVHQPAFVGGVAVGDDAVLSAADGAVATNNPLGQDEVIRHKVVTVRASFYGPNGQRYAEMLQDGMSVPQSNEMLRGKDAAIVTTDGEIITAADLLNQTWVRRFDWTFKVRIKVTRHYPIRNLLSAPVALNKD